MKTTQQVEQMVDELMERVAAIEAARYNDIQPLQDRVTYLESEMKNHTHTPPPLTKEKPKPYSTGLAS